MHQFRICLIILLGFCLVGCGGGSTTVRGPSNMAQTVQRQTIVPPEQYLAQAHNAQTGATNYHYLLLAEQSYVDLQQYDKAQALAQQIPLNTLSPEDQALSKLLSAQIALETDQAATALQTLLGIQNPSALPINLQIKRNELLAQAYEGVNQPLDSIKTRIAQALLLNDADAEEDNKQAIWRLTQQLPTDTLTQLSLDSLHQTLAGWAALALIVKQDDKQTQRFASDLRTWRVNYPNHPANSIASQLQPSASGDAIVTSGSKKKIAVLLPLHGSLGVQGDAILQGFMYAYYQTPTAQRPTLNTYDISQTDVSTAYQQAINEGATFIVGPLTKGDVDKLAGSNSKIVTLALNYSDTSAGDNFYEFGLSLRMDAEQVAQRIWKNNHGNVITITIDDANGNALLDTFNQQFTQLGGKIVDSLKITSSTDLNPAIASLLQAKTYTDKTTRKKSVTRRQDIDSIYMNLNPDQARAVVPLLQYYAANNLPMYATSLIYNGMPSPIRDNDLNKVMFTDMPWVIYSTIEYNNAHQTLSAIHPESFNAFNKFYAIGIDAYHLVFKLDNLRNSPDNVYNGVTGTLSLQNNHQIYRELSWGRFVKGQVTPLSNR